MEIILCCSSDQVKDRWTNVMGTRYALEIISSLEGLAKVIRPNDERLVIFHRDLVPEDKENLFATLTSRIKIFLLSDRPDDDEGLAFLKLGIVGYANTYSSPGRVNEAVRLIFGGSVWVGQQVMQRLIHETRVNPGQENLSYDKKILVDLTKREREIAELVAQGKTNLEIAYELGITERTVKSHLSSVFTKLGVSSRLNLALLINRGRG